MQMIFGSIINWGATRETEEIPDYGDVFTMDEFIDSCQIGCFTNYDGFGYYASETIMFRDIILPSYVTKRNNVKNYPYVVWFNR
jgi:hypothetical protein